MRRRAPRCRERPLRRSGHGPPHDGHVDRARGRLHDDRGRGARPAGDGRRDPRVRRGGGAGHPPGVAESFAGARQPVRWPRASGLRSSSTAPSTARRRNGTKASGWTCARSRRPSRLPSAPVVLQALHLAAALSEVAPTTTVLLSTSATRRPSERGHFRMILDGTRWLLDALRRLTRTRARPTPMRRTTNECGDVLLARVRERVTAEAPARLQRRFEELQNAIAGKTAAGGSAGRPRSRGPRAAADCGRHARRRGRARAARARPRPVGRVAVHPRPCRACCAATSTPGASRRRSRS